ncbi:PKD domain-containing protein [Flavobacterium sp.]|uniref:PKD domain-containing protein n=1 Tax=Flavobacterium sp. TaxID=239 RepID=UPI00286D8D6A|nr:PKD domain-containing protein [Flavobacterium sp.]
MKHLYTFLFGLIALQTQAQSSYTSANYAANGDIFYIASASNLAIDYVTTGTNYNWNFSTLTGISQEQLQFRSPNTTGFAWPFIFNVNNTNLSSTKNETNSLTVLGQTLGITNVNDYYKKTTSQLTQPASAYKINYNGTQIPVTNQFTDSDVIYNFPIDFGDNDSDNSSYEVNIPNIYYQNKTTQRTNEVDGWGSVTTPHGVFSNALRMKTTLVQNDTISVLGNGLPRVITTSRELKWFDISKKQPILAVTQNNISGNWVTSKVEYLDNQRDFQTIALFAYTPVNPAPSDIVYIQNLSTNATTYSWNFGDPSSGSLNTSSDQHPTHIFNSAGNYQVQLTSSNGTFNDTVTIPIVVGSLSSNEYNFENTGLVYPNPFTSKISVSDNLKGSDFYLYDIYGRIVYQGKNIQNQDFSNLARGSYILITKNGNKVVTYKLIK